MITNAAEAKDGLGAFSPTNYKTQYRYDDKTIAGDRLMQSIQKRKSEIDGCAVIINGDRGEYGSYYKVPGGFVAVELNLDISGKVQNTRIAQNTLPDSRVADCIQRQVKDLTVDVSGLKDFSLKKFLVLELKCQSQEKTTSGSIVSTRCSGSSQLYDTIGK